MLQSEMYRPTIGYHYAHKRTGLIAECAAICEHYVIVKWKFMAESEKPSGVIPRDVFEAEYVYVTDPQPCDLFSDAELRGLHVDEIA